MVVTSIFLKMDLYESKLEALIPNPHPLVSHVQNLLYQHQNPAEFICLTLTTPKILKTTSTTDGK